MSRLPVGCPPMLGRDQQRPRFFVSRPSSCDVTRFFGSAPVIDEGYNAPLGADVKIPRVSRRISADLLRIFHRHELRRTLSERQWLLVLLRHIGAVVPIGMKGEDEPIIVIDEGRLNFVSHVGSCAAKLIAIVGNLYRLPLFV